MQTKINDITDCNVSDLRGPAIICDMTDKFKTLEEFEALQGDEKIDLAATNDALDKLSFKVLNGALSRFVLVRKIRLNQWLKEMQSISGTPIRLRLTKEETTPYMQEDGLISFCKRDVLRADRLFMILAHETAHFILMRDNSYDTLKRINREYTLSHQNLGAMCSPIELCANLITLMILERCKRVEKSQKKQKNIEICIKSLKKQLTNLY